MEDASVSDEDDVPTEGATGGSDFIDELDLYGQSAVQANVFGLPTTTWPRVPEVKVKGSLHLAAKMKVTHKITAKEVHTPHAVIGTDPGGYPQIIDQSVAVIRDEESIFVETTAYIKVLKCVEETGTVVITGTEGCGKSTLGKALLRHFGNKGYTPLALNTYEEWRHYVGGKDRQQVILLDGIFGDHRFSYDHYKTWKRRFHFDYSMWSKTFPSMRHFARDKRCLVIMTLRTSIAGEINIKCDSDDVFEGMPLMDLCRSELLTDAQKMEMLQKHLESKDKTVDRGILSQIITHDCSGPRFPTGCKRFAADFDGDTDVGSIILQYFGSSETGRYSREVATLVESFDPEGKRGADIQTQSALKTFFLACRKNDTTRVRSFLKRGISTACTDEDGNTALHIACECGYIDLVSMLIRKSADLNARNLSGSTPLHYATSNGHLSVVKCLLEKDAAIDLQDQDGWTALHMACSKGKTSLIQLLIDHVASLQAETLSGDTPLHLACEGNDENAIRSLLESGAEKEARDNNGWRAVHTASHNGRHNIVSVLVTEFNASVKATTREEQTALHLACIANHSDVVETLLRSGAQKDCWDKRGRSPLHAASECGHETIVKMLLAEGANVESKDDEGCTPFHVACANGHTQLLSILAGSGAKTDTRTRSGRTPLHSASNFGHYSVVKWLLDNGAYADTKSITGSTPLHLACREGQEEVIGLLLQKFSDVNAENNRGATPFHFACENGNASVLGILTEYGASIDTKMKSGRAPIHTAAFYGHPEVVTWLIENGSDCDVKDKCGCTPLHYACFNSEEQVRVFTSLRPKEGAATATEPAAGWAPEEQVSYAGRVEAIKILLQHGADIDHVDKDKNTALHHACRGSADRTHMDVRELLCHGANTEIQDADGRIPLHVASASGNTYAVTFLLCVKSSVDARDKYGMTPLHYACEHDNAELVETLLNFNADIDAITATGKTPLHIASDCDHPEVVEILICYGADVDRTMPGDFTALQTDSESNDESDGGI